MLPTGKNWWYVQKSAEGLLLRFFPSSVRLWKKLRASVQSTSPGSLAGLTVVLQQVAVADLDEQRRTTVFSYILSRNFCYAVRATICVAFLPLGYLYVKIPDNRTVYSYKQFSTERRLTKGLLLHNLTGRLIKRYT